jgi:hypothetical protein
MPIDINISKIYSRVFSSLLFPILLYSLAIKYYLKLKIYSLKYYYRLEI